MRFEYLLRVYTDDGDLLEPTEEQLAIFKERHPDLAARWADSAAVEAGLPPGEWEEQCFLLLDSILKMKRAAWFREPVDPVKMRLHNYFEFVKQPMDLGTVKTRLLARGYESADAFAEMVRLTFSNCMTYNPAKSPPHEDASKLLRHFEKKFAEISGVAAPPMLPAAVSSASIFESVATGGAAEPSNGGVQPAVVAAADGGGAAAEAAAGAAGEGGSSDAAGGWAAGGGGAASGGGDAGGGGGSAAALPNPIIEDDSDDDDSEDEAEGGGEGRPTTGSKAPPDSVGGKHPTEGGKGPMEGEEGDDYGESAMSDSNVGEGSEDLASEMDDDDEGGMGDGGVSEADMFGDDDDDDGIDFGGGEEGEDGDFDDGLDDGYGEEVGSSSFADGGEASGEADDSVFEEDNE